jgi:predicted XRE-type DNA-binding protein
MNTNSVFFDLFEATEAKNLTIRSQLMQELEQTLNAKFKTQTEAADYLGVTQARISNLYTGKIHLFTIDTLINWLSKLGTSIEVTIKAA